MSCLWNVVCACVAVGVVVLSVATQEVASASDHATPEVWKPRAPGEVRCFCNLPRCVTSGYMCKSLRGGCFSDLFDLQDVYKARHGCLELLDSDQQGQCQNEPGHRRGNPRSLLLCCRSDMCNHVDGQEIKSRVEETSLARILNATAFPASPNFTANTNTEVWFKAATIAVPICGALILFALIALAVRILRGDGDRVLARKETEKHDAFGLKKQPLLAKCGCAHPRIDVERSCSTFRLPTERYDERTAGYCEKNPVVDV